jgi:hypothetical protein
MMGGIWLLTSASALQEAYVRDNYGLQFNPALCPFILH